MSAATALGGFLDALGVSPAAVPADLATRASLYRSLVAGRRMLIVLDNARDADQVRPLLPGSPSCAVLLTSRNQMSGLATTDDVHFLPLDVLDQSESQDLLARRLGRERVLAEAAAVRDIVAACGDLPLALSIVAVRAATRRCLSLRHLADEPADHRHKLDALAASDIRADLRSVFATSCHALSTPAATLFRLLATCAGADVGVAAAASLVGMSTRDPRGPLDELVTAHLVGMVTIDRLSCHDLLRQFAAELLTETERTTATRRLLDHYLHTAHVAGLRIEPLRDADEPPPPAAGVTTVALANAKDAQLWLDTERLALLAAVEQAADAGLDEHAWRLASALSTYLSRSSRWSDLLEVHASAWPPSASATSAGRHTAIVISGWRCTRSASVVRWATCIGPPSCLVSSPTWPVRRRPSTGRAQTGTAKPRRWPTSRTFSTMREIPRPPGAAALRPWAA